MNNRIKTIILTAIISVGLGLGTSAAVKNAKTQTPVTMSSKIESQMKASNSAYQVVNSLDVVAHPAKYLNKKITIRAKFDKFSTLGLDYKPAFKSSEKYITFLIKRDDVINHTVPLSEMKNFLIKEEAEKHIDLKSGDLIEYSGTVFSTALGDVWVNVDYFNVLSQKTKGETSPKK